MLIPADGRFTTPTGTFNGGEADVSLRLLTRHGVRSSFGQAGIAGRRWWCHVDPGNSLRADYCGTNTRKYWLGRKSGDRTSR
jgi:hypothetical protein